MFSYYFVITFFILVGCDENEPKKEELINVESLGATATGDSVYFTANVPYAISDVASYGFVIASDKSLLSSKEAKVISLSNPLSIGRFSTKVFNDFRESSVYYCQAFVSAKSKKVYGEILSFPGLGGDSEIKDFSPMDGDVGDFVKIYGQHFDTQEYRLQVYFDELKAEIIEATADRIVVKVPKYDLSGPVVISVEKNGQRFVAEKKFLFKGPVINSFTPGEALDKVTFQVQGKYFMPEPWRNKMTLWRRINPELVVTYDVPVTNSTTGSLTGELSLTSVMPGQYQLIVTVNDIQGFASGTFDVLTPWQRLASKPASGIENSASFSINNKIYVCTGSTTGYYSKEFWEYDIAMDRWTRKADFPGEARTNALGFTINGKGYVGLGIRSTNYDGNLSDLWEYNPATDSWLQKASLSALEISSAEHVTYNGKAYVAMLYSSGVRQFWSYDPGNNAWAELPAYPGDRRDWSPIFVVSNGNLYVNGGSYWSKEIWKFNFATKIWTRSVMLQEFQTHYAFSYHDNCYIIRYVFNDYNLEEMRLSLYDPETNVVLKDLNVLEDSFLRQYGIGEIVDDTYYLGLGYTYDERLSDLMAIHL